ncbi:MAG: hypothetical protein JW760_15420 [Spirochaetales bacterium]|nr:hypothetical protein [Spirochaetales bacterium]
MKGDLELSIPDDCFELRNGKKIDCHSVTDYSEFGQEFPGPLFAYKKQSLKERWEAWIGAIDR